MHCSEKKLLREFIALSSKQYVLNHLEGHTLSIKGKPVLDYCSLSEHRSSDAPKEPGVLPNKKPVAT